MDSQKVDEFLKAVLSYVKYPFSRNDIRFELKEHILDKIDYYKGQDYDEKTAEELAIKDMGDPKEVGILLNNQHNPIIGWLISITSVFMVILIVLSIISTTWVLLISTFGVLTPSPIGQIPKEDIVYRMDINEKVQIDDRVIKFTNIVYDKKGILHVITKDYDKKIWRMGWGFGSLGIIKDDKGNEYNSSSGFRSNGTISRSRRGIKDFPNDAKTLIIEYDNYNRYYRVEIPLKSGELHD